MSHQGSSEKSDFRRFQHNPQSGASAPIQLESEQAQRITKAAKQARTFQPPVSSTSFLSPATAASLPAQFHPYPVVFEEPMSDQKSPSIPPNVVIHNDVNRYDKAVDTMGRMESEVTIDTSVLPPAIREDSSHVDSESAYEILPVHGILNRGGAFVPPSFRDGEDGGMSPHNSCRWSNGGGNGKDGAQLLGTSCSFRTNGSLSSYEDDHHPHAHYRARIGNMADLFETSESSLSSKEGKEDGRPSTTDRSSRTGSVAKTTSTAIGSKHGDSRLGSHALGSDFFEIVETLRQASDTPEVAAMFLQELASINYEDVDADLLMDRHALKATIEAMESCKRSFEVQLWGCKAIGAMGNSKQDRSQIIDSGCLKAVIDATEDFPDQLDVLESALTAMSNLISGGKSVESLVEEKGVETIVKIIGLFSSQVPVLVRSFDVVAKLAKTGLDHRKAILESGAGESLFSAMVMNPCEVQLHVSAFAALNRLCEGSEENITAMVNFGLCDVIVTAMEIHRDEAVLQEFGAELIATLAVIDENKHAIGDNNGRLVLLRAMCVHENHEGVVAQCMKALSLLTLDLFIVEILIEEGVIEIVFKAMQDYLDSSLVQECGCAILANLAKLSDVVKKRLVDEGALDQINVSMACHENESSLHAKACETILWLSIPENFKPMIAANIVQHVQKSRERFPEPCGQHVNEVMAIFESFLNEVKEQS
jgi:hypothetical protein